MPTSEVEQSVIMDAAAVQRAVARMAHAISEENLTSQEVVLIGIQTGGVQLAGHLARHLERLWGHPVPVGELDISMHRDDLDQRMVPVVHRTYISADITGKVVVLVDDVLFSGRTTRAALDALNDLGRPKRTQLAVLVDRGHRELPIEANFVGETIQTSLTDRVEVQLGERAEDLKVVLTKG
jgi:pyrimidine operon attenuation protein/uracil phosphoribosyltransferase